MTATEELRRMLDERGVEWMDDSYANLWCTVWHGREGKQWRMTENRSGMLTELKAWHVTPEQAIEATLGETPTPPPPTMPEQPPYDLLIDLLRDDWDIEASWDGLRRFWCVGLTDEGVRKRDEREATLGRGTCHNAMPLLPGGMGMPYPDSWMCSECGGRMDGIILETGNYCPNCGRKVVDE